MPLKGALLDSRSQRRLKDFSLSCSNFISAFSNFPEWTRNINRLGHLKKSLRSIAKVHQAPAGRIPKIFHFVLVSDGPKEISFVTLMAVASALHYNPEWKAIFHCTHEPTGHYWRCIKPRLIVNLVPALNYFGIANLRHPAHQADIIRLLALTHVGGIYLDTDTLTIKSFADLLDKKFVMAVQAALYDIPAGLCNATILSARRAKFINRWLSKYSSFRSRGFDRYWDYHSVKVPALLSFYHPHEIEVLPFDSFFFPLWADLERVLLKGHASTWLPYLKRTYVFHLWNGFTKDILAQVNESFLAESNSLYAHFARPVLKFLK